MRPLLRTALYLSACLSFSLAGAAIAAPARLKLRQAER